MDNNETFEWSSKRVPPGGVFHHPRVSYSKETHEILKTLMEESKLSLYQQRKIDWNLRNGLSLIDAKYQANKERSQSAANHARNPPKISRRRPLTAIKSSGDFERESDFRFRPNQRNEDRELVKARLQHIMEFGKKQNQFPSMYNQVEQSSHQQKLPEKYDILQDLLSQIREREDWLKEMESLGEGSKHREMIEHQIAERIRRIEALNFPEKIIDLHVEGKEIISGRSSGRTSGKSIPSEGTSSRSDLKTTKKRNDQETIADIISYI